jgi:hypothetical protein
MRARGYPMADFEQQAADISVDHPHLVSEYRAGHEIAERAAADGADTEELRQAMVHYRTLFEDLLGTNEGEPQGDMSASGPRGEADNGEMPASRAEEDRPEPAPAAIDEDRGPRP